MLVPQWREQPQACYIIMSGYDCRNKSVSSFAQALSVSDEEEVIVIPSSQNLGQWAGLLCLDRCRWKV